jgi:hypothetical protein
MILELPSANEILGAMITPALLISAAGTLVVATGNRLGRVVDRVRTLSDMAEHLHPPDDELAGTESEKRMLIVDQLTKLSVRCHRLVQAITLLYTAIGLLVASSISVGVVAIVQSGTGWIPVGLGLLGAGALFYASTLLVREARLAVDSTLHEMTYVGKLVARKAGYGKVRRPL